MTNEARRILAACPFCGETERLSVQAVGSMTADMPARPYRVICTHLDHDTVCGPTAYGRGAAMTAWNTRALHSTSWEAGREAAAKVAKYSREQLEPFVGQAALDWCGEKERETFPEDIEYFKHNWWALQGLQGYVRAAAIRQIPPPGSAPVVGEEVNCPTKSDDSIEATASCPISPDNSNSDELPIGCVQWHSSEEDGGPDVGVLLRLGKDAYLWCGEITNKEAEEYGANPGRWHFALHRGDKRLIAGQVVDEYCAREAVDEIAASVRSAAPTPPDKVEGVRVDQLSYQQLFDAIAAAVRIEAGGSGIGVSVKAFREHVASLSSIPTREDGE